MARASIACKSFEGESGQVSYAWVDTRTGKVALRKPGELKDLPGPNILVGPSYPEPAEAANRRRRKKEQQLLEQQSNRSPGHNSPPAVQQSPPAQTGSGLQAQGTKLSIPKDAWDAAMRPSSTRSLTHQSSDLAAQKQRQIDDMAILDDNDPFEDYSAQPLAAQPAKKRRRLMKAAETPTPGDSSPLRAGSAPAAPSSPVLKAPATMQANGLAAASTAGHSGGPMAHDPAGTSTPRRSMGFGISSPTVQQLASPMPPPSASHGFGIASASKPLQTGLPGLPVLAEASEQDQADDDEGEAYVGEEDGGGVEEDEGDQGSDDQAAAGSAKDERANDPLCPACDDGGLTIQCDGMCMRSFHIEVNADSDSEAGPSCNPMQMPADLYDQLVKDDDPFQCPNCLAQCHQCFVCGKEGSSSNQHGVPEVFKCAVADCTRFYHPACIGKTVEDLLDPGQPLLCALHHCAKCKRGADEDCPLVPCRRCPTAYHRKCLPATVTEADVFNKRGKLTAPKRLWILESIFCYCPKHTIDPETQTPHHKVPVFAPQLLLAWRLHYAHIFRDLASSKATLKEAARRKLLQPKPAAQAVTTHRPALPAQPADKACPPATQKGAAKPGRAAAVASESEDDLPLSVRIPPAHPKAASQPRLTIKVPVSAQKRILDSSSSNEDVPLAQRIQRAKASKASKEATPGGKPALHRSVSAPVSRPSSAKGASPPELSPAASPKGLSKPKARTTHAPSVAAGQAGTTPALVADATDAEPPHWVHKGPRSPRSPAGHHAQPSAKPMPTSRPQDRQQQQALEGGRSLPPSPTAGADVPLPPPPPLPPSSTGVDAAQGHHFGRSVSAPTAVYTGSAAQAVSSQPTAMPAAESIAEPAQHQHRQQQPPQAVVTDPRKQLRLQQQARLAAASAAASSAAHVGMPTQHARSAETTAALTSSRVDLAPAGVTVEAEAGVQQQGEEVERDADEVLDARAHAEAAAQLVAELLAGKLEAVTPAQVKANAWEPVPYDQPIRKTIAMDRLGQLQKSVDLALAHPEARHLLLSQQVLRELYMYDDTLRTVLAPFLHGPRYTSYGRHFTKAPHLQVVSHKLLDYLRTGDCVVDFSCGANEFVPLVKREALLQGFAVRGRSFDILAPKHMEDFHQISWFDVGHEHLLPGDTSGDRLVIGLNPPFGKDNALANKWVMHAAKLTPRVIVLIVPPRTVTPPGYHVIYDDQNLCRDKAFYVPGSDQESWNQIPPAFRILVHERWLTTAVNMADLVTVAMVPSLVGVVWPMAMGQVAMHHQHHMAAHVQHAQHMHTNMAANGHW